MPHIYLAVSMSTPKKRVEDAIMAIREAGYKGVIAVWRLGVSYYRSRYINQNCLAVVIVPPENELKLVLFNCTSGVLGEIMEASEMKIPLFLYYSSKEANRIYSTKIKEPLLEGIPGTYHNIGLIGKGLFFDSSSGESSVDEVDGGQFSLNPSEAETLLLHRRFNRR